MSLPGSKTTIFFMSQQLRCCIDAAHQVIVHFVLVNRGLSGILCCISSPNWAQGYQARDGGVVLYRQRARPTGHFEIWSMALSV